jgi:hypothetical protein
LKLLGSNVVAAIDTSEYAHVRAGLIQKVCGFNCQNGDADSQTARDFHERISGFFRDVASGTCAGYPRIMGNTVT